MHTVLHTNEVTQIIQLVLEIFEDEAKANAWMASPNRALNNKKPVELFNLPGGPALVGQVLQRIKEGIYS